MIIILINQFQGTPHPEIPFKRYKDLDKAWSAFPNFNATNTILFDDSAFKAFKHPKNMFQVNTFVPRDQHDEELFRLESYIRDVLLDIKLENRLLEETLTCV
ncbi:MAG: hypothetical protein EOP45_18655 [Sphingobacteriaceae bacterium]|nr:MAG: hypothetical protein EOP45_18655 [Sphingobacteriaceae bacterium]